MIRRAVAGVADVAGMVDSPSSSGKGPDLPASGLIRHCFL